MPNMKKPPNKDNEILPEGFSSVGAGDRLAKVFSWHGFVCGFDSRPALCRYPRRELALLPGIHNRTAETAWPDNLSIRLSAYISKEGHADGSTQRARFTAC